MKKPTDKEIRDAIKILEENQTLDNSTEIPLDVYLKMLELVDAFERQNPSK